MYVYKKGTKKRFEPNNLNTLSWDNEKLKFIN